ncbi:hypothetical protein R1flu_000128 [Riccia fluitans]|uniref:Phosphate-induced protein 1 n=1 Tax=Riccia fluitans TaxID=41844 RepID=A0ABD1XZR1_9MARC
MLLSHNMQMMKICCAAVLLAMSLLPGLHADPHTHVTSFISPTPHPVATKHGTKNLKEGSGAAVPQSNDILLDYHMGPVMTGIEEMIKLFIIYYGDFGKKQRSILRHFFKSFQHPHIQLPEDHPTVEKWWQITRGYVDLYDNPVARNIVLAAEVIDDYSLGKRLNQSEIQTLVIDYMVSFGTDSRSIYVVLTSEDVVVDRFCYVCGSHFYTFPSDETKGQMVPYGWVGNPAVHCPGLCSWPYAPGGIFTKPLIPPNGDVGIDGMIITIASLLASVATDPYGSGYYQDDSGLEAVGACQGIYGKGSYNGYPGELLVDNATGASFNVFGAGNARYLIPWMWNRRTQVCAGQV